MFPKPAKLPCRVSDRWDGLAVLVTKVSGEWVAVIDLACSANECQELGNLISTEHAMTVRFEDGRSGTAKIAEVRFRVGDDDDVPGQTSEFYVFRFTGVGPLK